MEQLFQKFAPACAMVMEKNPGARGVEFLGSAFVVRQGGWLFTAAEVVKGKTQLLVSPAEEPLGFQPMSREQLLGFPFGRHGTLVLTARHSHLAAKMLSADGRQQLLVEGAVYSGAAGGALVDVRRGRIVGVLGTQLALLPKEGMLPGKFNLPQQTDLSLAAPIEAAAALLKA